MSAMASQITGVSMVCSTVCSGAHQRKHQSFASLAFVGGIRRLPVNSPHKGPATRKMVPFDDVIMSSFMVTSRGVAKPWVRENSIDLNLSHSLKTWRYSKIRCAMWNSICAAVMGVCSCRRLKQTDRSEIPVYNGQCPQHINTKDTL